MTPSEIRAQRLAKRFWPRLWAFAYPVKGRPFPMLRLAALRLWCWGLAREWEASER